MRSGQIRRQAANQVRLEVKYCCRANIGAQRRMQGNCRDAERIGYSGRDIQIIVEIEIMSGLQRLKPSGKIRSDRNSAA